jgi:hypothetical protein
MLFQKSTNMLHSLSLNPWGTEETDVYIIFKLFLLVNVNGDFAVSGFLCGLLERLCEDAN